MACEIFGIKFCVVSCCCCYHHDDLVQFPTPSQQGQGVKVGRWSSYSDQGKKSALQQRKCQIVKRNLKYLVVFLAV